MTKVTRQNDLIITATIQVSKAHAMHSRLCCLPDHHHHDYPYDDDEAHPHDHDSQYDDDGDPKSDSYKPTCVIQDMWPQSLGRCD